MTEMELAESSVDVGEGPEFDEKGHRRWWRWGGQKDGSTTPTPTPTEPEPTPTEPEPTPTQPTPTPTDPAPAPSEPAPADSVSTSAPFVTGVTNSSGTLTIAGSGFGSAKVTPLLWDDFEGGTAGARIASTPKVGTWKPVNAAQTTYSTAQKYSGTKSLYGARTPSSQWANFDVTIPDGKTFIQSFWFRYSYPAGGMGQAKLSQIHGTYGVGDYNPGVMTGGFAGDWWGSYIALENSGMYNRVSYPAQPSMNAWHHFELLMKQSDPGVANGEVTIRIDGQPVYRQSPVKTRERSGHRWNLAAFFTGMTNFTGNTYTWIDDVYFSDSWARVVLCESPTYTSCTRKVLQPLKTWGTNGITASQNRGAFQAGQTAYLFVVDAAGRTNAQGYPVVVR